MAYYGLTPYVPRVQVRLFGRWHDASNTRNCAALLAACERANVPMRRFRPRATCYGPARPTARRSPLRRLRLMARGCPTCRGAGDCRVPSMVWDTDTVYCAGCAYGRALASTDARGHRAYALMSLR